MGSGHAKGLSYMVSSCRYATRWRCCAAGHKCRASRNFNVVAKRCQKEGSCFQPERTQVLSETETRKARTRPLPREGPPPAASGPCGAGSRPPQQSRPLPGETRPFPRGAREDRGQQSEARPHASEAPSTCEACAPAPAPADRRGRPGRARGKEPRETTEVGWQKSAPRGKSRSLKYFRAAWGWTA